MLKLSMRYSKPNCPILILIMTSVSKTLHLTLKKYNYYVESIQLYKLMQNDRVKSFDHFNTQINDQKLYFIFIFYDFFKAIIQIILLITSCRCHIRISFVCLFD